jgi:hypothetical protein
MLLGRLIRVAQCFIVASTSTVSSFSSFRQRTASLLRSREVYYMTMEPMQTTETVGVRLREEVIGARLEQVFAAVDMEDLANAAALHLQQVVSNSQDRSLEQTSILAANHFRIIASTVGGRKARQALESAAQDLLRASLSSTPAASYLAFSATAVALALSVVDASADPADIKSYRASSRSAASAMAYTLQRQGLQSDLQLTPASGILLSLLRVCSSSSSLDDGVTVDWHIVTMIARAFQLDSKNDKDVALAVATIAKTALCLDDYSDTSPEKIQAAGALALVAQMKPWTVLEPVVTIKPAVMMDLWEAAERICASAADDDHGAASEAVQALIQEALEGARLFRQADKLATKFYECGGKVHYLEARYLHACDTVAKVIRKGAIPVIERQVERVDSAVIRVVKDGIVPSSSAGDEIRDFAMRQLEEVGDIQAAHRLAGEWGLDYVHDEEALKVAALARKEKYLQWEDVLSGSPPDLLSSADALVSAFEIMVKDQSRFGFDVEWSEDSAGAEILQVSTCHIAILIDLPALSKTPEGTQALTQTLGSLFADSSKVVVGFGCKQDLSKLRSTRCEGGKHWLSGTNAVVDAQPLAEQKEESKRTIGLSRVCEKYLGKPLDKSEQCSVWNARPLSIRQRAYASLDAWACAALYEQLCPNLKRSLE